MPEPVTVVAEIGEEDMAAIDLPENVVGLLLKTGSEIHQGLVADIVHNGANVHNIARLSAVRKFDEVGTMEGRANSGVNATPIASPATGGGG